MAKLVIQPITQVVFDFDNTLYDTEKRKEFFWSIARIHGYSQVEAYQMYNEARLQGDKITMSLETYLETVKKRLAKDAKDFLTAKVEKIVREMETADQLLPGARDIVEWCQKKKIDSYLLSLGVREWQEAKFYQSGLQSYFDLESVVFTDDSKKGKSDSLVRLFGKRFDGHETIIINDKPDETRELLRDFPKLIALVRREIRDVRYREKDFEKLEKDFPGRVAVAIDLKSLQKILSNFF
jgi:beta-phosphoglucomutase-like phosphatase (HAD superfamily)